MANILIPVDFSTISESAIKAGLQIASALDSEIIFLHLIEARAKDIFDKDSRNDFHRRVLNEVTKKTGKMEEYSKWAAKEKVRSEYYLNYDREYSSLIDFAEKNHVGLIVMGTHGASGTREILFGTHSQRIARLSYIPVLVVKEGNVPTEFRRVAFFTDLTEPPGEGFEALASICRILRAELHLVTLDLQDQSMDHDETMQKMGSYSSLIPEQVIRKDLFNSVDIESGVTEYCETHNIDIAAMVTHSERSNRGLFAGSVTEKMVNHLKFPVMSLHN